MHLRLSQISTVGWTPQRSHFLLLRSCSHCSSFLEQGTLWKPHFHVFPWSLSSQFRSGPFTFPKGGRHFMSKWNIITKALRALEHFSSSLLTQSWSLWLSGPVPTHQATALGLVSQPSSRWLMPQPNKLLIYVQEHPQESKEQTDLGCRTHKKKKKSLWSGFSSSSQVQRAPLSGEAQVSASIFFRHMTSIKKWLLWNGSILSMDIFKNLWIFKAIPLGVRRNFNVS